MTVDIATLGIRVDSSEARTAARDMDGMQQAGRRAEASVSALEAVTRKLQAALAFLGVGTGAAAIIKMSDDYAKLTAQLRLATDSQRAYALAYGDVKRIANDAQQDLAATGMLYARVAKATAELGTTQKAVAAITETVSLAMKVSGASANESAQAQLQLSQAFASGALRGDEFNAVNEAAPRLMKALADGLGAPVGALRAMASEGKITSQIMAEVLPKALQQLQEEAKQVQTIGGAFTVLKNNIMEFTGVQAQASGFVSVVTGAIGLLANNLNVLVGVIATVAAAKMATSFSQWATGAYASVAANRALLASNLAAAEANVVASAASHATAVAREHELRASVLAAEGVVALAIAQNGLIPAQARATAAAAAHTAALTAQTAAAGAASVGSGLLRGAMGLLGGPVGAVVTILGVAATAWSWYSSKSDEANKGTAEGTRASTAEIVAQMQKQIDAMNERNRVSALGIPATKSETPAGQRLAEVMREIDQVSKAQGEYASLTLAARQDILMKLGGQYGELTAVIERFNKASADGVGNTAAAQAVIDIRERLSGVNKQYMDDLNKLQAALAAGAVGEAEYVGLVSQLAAETYKKSAAGKESISTTNKEAEAYESLISSIRAATAENRLELAAGQDATASQKARIKLDQELASGKLKLSVGHLAVARTALDEQAATEQLLKTQAAEKDVMGWIAQSTQVRLASKDALAVEYAAYGRSTDARELAMVAARNESDVEKFLFEHRKAGKPVTDEMIGQLKLEAAERTKAEQATMAQSKALGYASQLQAENQRFTAESITDERARAASLLAIEANSWQQRIALATEGTLARQKLEQEYLTWYANQSAKPMLDEQRRAVEKYGDIFRTGFADMLNDGKAGWSSFTKSLVTTFKTSVADQIYKMFAQPFVVKMVASLLGVTGAGVSGAAGAAQAVGGAGNALCAASNLSSLYGAATGGLAGSIGSGIAAAGNFVGSSAMSAFGAGFANVGGAAISVSESFAAAGMAVEASAASIGAAFSAALPWIGGAVLAYKVLSKVFDKGPEQNTRLTFTSNNTPGNISINERGNEGKTGQSYIDGSSSGAFGSFGLSSTFWSDGFSETVQSFIKTVTKVDDVLAGYLTDSEKAKATAAVTGKAITANLGAQGTDQNGKGELDAVFGARMKLIFESLEPGMAKLIDGFKGTSQELATEAAGLLQYRQALVAGGEAVFGVKVTMQELAALKAPSEATSAALARVTSEFAATNAVAAALGKTGAQAFGAVGLASLGAREQLITLSGGMDALGKNIGSFAQNYLSEAERLAPVTKAVESAMAELGLSSVTTREQFKQQVQGLDLTTEAGAKMFGKLMGLQDAFAQVHPAVESTAALLELQAQRYEVLGDKAGAAAVLEQQHVLALKDMTPALAAANQALWDAQKAEKEKSLASEEAAAILEQQAQMYEATGDKAGAAAVLLKQHEAALVGLSPALAAATQATWAAQAAQKAKADADAEEAGILQARAAMYAANGDQAGAAAVLLRQHTIALAQMAPALAAATQAQWDAEAAAKAMKVATDEQNAILQLQERMYVAMGDTASAALVVQKQQELALVGMTRAMQDASKATWAAEKAAGAIKDAQEKAKVTEKQYADHFEKARSVLAQAYDRESSALEQTIEKSQQAAKAFRAFSDSLKLGDLSTLSPEQKYLEAQRQFATATPEQLQGASSALLEASKAYNSNNEAYARDYEAVQSAIGKAAVAADGQAMAAQAQLGYLAQQVAGIAEVNKSVLSVAAALAGYKAAAAVVPVSAGGTGPAIPSAPKPGYLANTTSGWTNTDWAYVLKQAGVGAHARGGVGSGWSLVGEEGPELVDFASPGRVYTASQTQAMLGGGASNEVASLLRELLAENREMKAELQQVKQTGQAAITQRGAIAQAQLRQGDVVAQKLDKTARKLEANS